jgi:hypothetical protein
MPSPCEIVSSVCRTEQGRYGYFYTLLTFTAIWFRGRNEHETGIVGTLNVGRIWRARF